MLLSTAPWREAGRAAERWLLPGDCLLCHERDRQDDLICPVCRSRWHRVPDPVCDRCGQPLDRETGCRLCPEWPTGFGQVRSGVWLESRARRAVHLLKYDGWWRLAEAMPARWSAWRPSAPAPYSFRCRSDGLGSEHAVIIRARNWRWRWPTAPACR